MILRKRFFACFFLLSAICVNSQEFEITKVSRDIAVIVAAEEGGVIWKDKLNQAVSAVKYNLPLRTLPVEIVYGYSTNGFERAINRLKTRGIEKLLLIPAYPNTYDDKIEYLKFLFALIETPPRDYLKPEPQDSSGFTSFFERREIFEPEKEYSHLASKQVENDLPVAMTSAIDAAMVSDTLKNALKPLRFVNRDLCLAVVSEGNDNYSEPIAEAFDTPLQELATELDLKSIKFFLLDPGQKSSYNEKTIKKIKRYIKDNLLKCKTIVAGYSLYHRRFDKMLEKELFGSFYVYGRTANPSVKQVQSWLKEKILQAQGMPANEKFALYEEKSKWKIF